MHIVPEARNKETNKISTYELQDFLFNMSKILSLFQKLAVVDGKQLDFVGFQVKVVVENFPRH